MLKQCLYCECELISKWINKKTRFCSRRCSNLYRAANTNYCAIQSTKLKKKYREEPWGFHCLSEETKAKIQKERIYKKKSWSEKVFSKSWDDLSEDYKKVRVKLEQNNKCAFCNLDEWRGAKLLLELDHIDGNRMNNARDNLRALCPNCHTTTETYRGRNKLRGKFPSDSVLYKKYKEVGNIRQTLLAFNLAAKGGNYTRVKSIISRFEPLTQFETTIQYN